jgi:hypothetical protein
LLEIRRHVRIVAPLVHIVEYNVDDAFDLAARRLSNRSGQPCGPKHGKALALCNLGWRHF